MVLDAFVEGCKKRFSCAYRGFAKFKCEIFRGWNEQLGQLYDYNYGDSWDENRIRPFLDFDELAHLYNEKENGIIAQKMKKILDEYDKPFNEGMKLFFNLSDKEVSPKECKLILEALERVDIEKFDKSDKDTYEWVIESLDIWKTMLKYAVDNNKNLICG